MDIVHICDNCNGTGKVLLPNQSKKIFKTALDCLEKQMTIKESVNFVIKKYKN